ncbi:MMPL family transporter [Jatrophihabitans sp. YIM 134969]
MIVWLLLGGLGGSYQGKLSEVQKNDNSAYLPESAESTEASNVADVFSDSSTIPGFVVWQRDGGLTSADRQAIEATRPKLVAVDGVAQDQVGVTTWSEDGTAASLQVPLVAATGDDTVNGDVLADVEKKVIAVAEDNAPDGVSVHPAGPGGLLVAFIDAFAGIDGKLVGIAGVVVIVLLLLVYRSPVLWIYPLLSAGLALGVSSIVVYYLAKADLITLSGQSQGILSVLVIGAGTDYALLLVSRYREELHNYENRFDAMWRAWKGAAPAIVASAATVILGLLCLLFGTLKADSGLGPVCAVGIACTVLVMLTFLPVFLAVSGRWIFWPKRPRPDGQSEMQTHAVWGRIAGFVSDHARAGWITVAVVLFALVALIPNLHLGTLSNTEQFTNTPDAVTGQEIYNAKFDQGAGAPAIIVLNASALGAVTDAVEATDGVATDVPGAVCLQPDYRKLADAFASGQQVRPGADGCLPSDFSVQPKEGRTVLQAQLVSSYDSPAATATIERLRDAVHAVPGADALVGGSTAANLDVANAANRDRNVIIPIVLVVILVVLALLLRALVAPLLLIATVVLSFFATLGVSGFFFQHVFGFAAADTSFVLYAFVFLVALGIDYNIFLMTRIREETLEVGTHRGITRGLAVTGGVITSAGLVLASTFAVLGVLPLVVLAEVGFAVAFGVLLDTFIVRSILVPALSHDIGRKIWWSSRLAAGAE